MSITLTITDPTPEQARLAADALLMLFDNASDSHVIVPSVDPTIAAALQARNEISDDGSGESSGDSPSIDTAAAFGTVDPPSQPQTQIGAPMLDSAGLPWDGRIHAESKATIADGTWRKRRNVDDATVASVTAELRAAMAAPAPSADNAPPAPPTPVVTLVPPPPVDAAPVAPPPPATVGPMTFPQLMLRITALPPGPETQQRVLAAVQSAGLPSLAMLGARPDLVPTVAAALGVS